jgi:hypothetical protein
VLTYTGMGWVVYRGHRERRKYRAIMAEKRRQAEEELARIKAEKDQAESVLAQARGATPVERRDTDTDGRRRGGFPDVRVSKRSCWARAQPIWTPKKTSCVKRCGGL